MEFWPNKNRKSKEIKIADYVIPNVENTRFLGVYLDANLNWKYHASQVYNKIQSNQQLLNMSKNTLSLPSLIKLCYAHIYSHISYGIVVRGSMLSSSSQQEIFKAQKACLHTIYKAKKNASTDELFKKNGILKLPDIIKLELIKFGYRLSRKDLPTPIQNIVDIRQETKTSQIYKHIPVLNLI